MIHRRRDRRLSEARCATIRTREQRPFRLLLRLLQ
jgi:hypothetical protein